MPPDAEPRSKHTPADQEYLDSLSARQLMDFRNYLFSPTYIALNAAKFLDYEWVDVGELRKYLQHTAAVPAPAPVKTEAIPPFVTPGPTGVVKAEPVGSSVSAEIKLHALNEGGREVFELLSDSEPEDTADSDLEVIATLRHVSRSSSAAPLTDPDHFADDDEAATSSFNLADADHFTDNYDSNVDQPFTGSGDTMLTDDDASDLEESDTVWQDDGKSFLRTGKLRVTQKLTVERVEYRVGPAVIYPIHRTRTAIVVDLANATYRDPGTNQLYTLNTIIMNADNDSWEWLGGSRKTVQVVFTHGKKPIECQRIRYRCKAPRNAIIAAQQETRRREGNTQEERVAIFMTNIRGAKCLAVNSLGNKCPGGPVLKAKREGSSRGHQYFVGCSGWTPKFKQGHRIHNIPDNVDENLLANALAGRPLSDDRTKDTPPCSGLIHPHTGLRKKTCPHAHIVNGMQVQGRIQNYPCDAVRTIFVPTDPSIFKVLIVHNTTGHNHPMPTLTKVSFSHKETYRQCIEANGVLGASVAKIDNAPSTSQLLKGKTPAAHAAPLHNKRVKQDLLHAAKLEKYPNGLGVDAILPMFHEELTKPLPERYIHSHITTKKGEIIIVTFVPYLLKLLDDPGVTSFDGDATYKGIEGKLNEWELSIFAKVVQRAASLLRAYINGASADFFEDLFDELQRVKLMVTGKPIALKRFVRGGNLLVTNVDMDGAQALGLCRSVMKYNDPEYSGIANDTPPEEIASEFIKLCWRHGKEPIHDFKSLVSAEQYARIQDVFYIDSTESLEEFSSFIYGLGHKKISDWWRHKEMHAWIIPCLVKSQSRIPADVWDSTPSTTNTNEAQHHWTNSLTGIKLTPVEALESRRKVDQNVAREIQMSMQTGILSNSNNELAHRMARNGQRQSAAARRARESREAGDISKELQRQIDDSVATTKRLKEQLKAAKGPSVDVYERRARVQSDESDNLSTTAVLTVTPTQSEAPSMPADWVQPSVDSTFGSTFGFDVDFDSFLASLGSADTSLSFFAQDTYMAQSSSYDPTLDPTIFGFPGGDFNALMPASSGIPVADPFGEFMTMYGSSGVFPDTTASDFDGTVNLVSGAPCGNQLPSLPPPPPESPPAPSPPAEHRPESKPRRVRKEVDEANIITSTRSRAPTVRKRLADGEISERPQKKAKSN
ncbi:hypothetical protein DFH07DRAFT_964017 [Mycena maculata]|uniref:Uncharacterized protein n=1 Tax=Mycena maculata TaxID=230809 RepID=A0AAD7IJJ8_9AGAR|nr:hypothetical protein DFH07DRAFT_964017 [Mycena maculata]